MAGRTIHNNIAKSILRNMSITKIDELNKKIDEPYKTMGRYHRVLNHSTDPARIDSLIITNGNMDKEMVRQVHIFVDNHKKLAELVELNELIKKLKK